MTNPVEFNFGDDDSWEVGLESTPGVWTAAHTYAQPGEYTVTARDQHHDDATNVVVPPSTLIGFTSIDPTSLPYADGAGAVNIAWTGVDPSYLIFSQGGAVVRAGGVAKTGEGVGAASVPSALPEGTYEVTLGETPSEPESDPLSFEVTAAPVVGRTVTAINPSDTANVGDLVTLTGTGLTGVGVAALVIAGGFATPMDNPTVVSDTEVTGNVASGSAGTTVASALVADDLGDINGPSRAELTGLNLVVT
jgi:hypothetical protein